MKKSELVAERAVDKVLSGVLKRGRLTVDYPSGHQKTYGDKSKAVKITIKSLSLTRLKNPPLFIGESYMDRNLEIDENDLDAFFKLMGQNQADPTSLRLLGKLQKHQPNRKKYQRKQISHHYDIGNDYYKLWLDQSMTYSCAYFHKPSDTLEKAQQQKIDYTLKKLQLKPGQRLLDIGCGWGTLCVQAAKQYKVKALGITLSQEQLAGATRLAEQAGVSDLVSFKLMNYQDLPNDQQFDRVVSVGMYEHVGRGNHAAYFEKLQQLMTDSGVSVLHTITERMDKKASPWIDKYIFPGGHLPTVDSIEALLAQYKFWSIDRENLWQHYALTLDIWRARHQAHQAEIIDMFDERFYRMQDFWLAGSAATFRYGDTGINQFIFTKRKPEFLDWPLNRNYLYD
ncbi:MAG TPA: cyclopropane-fatty-acyl-phospholipid synthase family protein [Candidatus Saccharimonadales bacterium]|jgi:cyclopropane-fatty-acyl-phospholipid synthase|nr:cyclopropane-fatty-acyl-phospholipid synthase family protein [Candidatus Saccharimonadales bacterium]